MADRAWGHIVDMTGSVFINYRRDDEPNFAMLLYTRLERKFAADRLFMDVDSIAPGDDFVGILRDNVEKCDVVLSIIGANWINARDHSGNRRLDDPNDFVRIEIEQALELGKRVIPVLVGTANMPRREDLPDSLKPLVTRNAVRFSHDKFRLDAENLERALDRLFSVPPAKPQGVAGATDAQRPAANVLARQGAGEIAAGIAPHAAGTLQQVDTGIIGPHTTPTKPVGPAIAGSTADGSPRLAMRNWQRALVLGALATLLYLLIAALRLLLATSPIAFSINATFEYSYNPSYDFGLVAAVSVGLYLFAGFGPLRSAVAFAVLTVLAFAIDLAIHACASLVFATLSDFYGGGELGTFIWFVYSAAFAAPFLLAVSVFCPAVRSPIVLVPTVLLAALTYYYFASGGAPAFGTDSAFPSFGFVACQIITAAVCGWMFGPARFTTA